MSAVLAALLALAAQAAAAPAQPGAWPALGTAPGGSWACAPEHEGWRQADLRLLQADMARGLAGAATDLPQLQAALAHAPEAPLGGIAVCDGRTLGFNPTAAFVALAAAAAKAKTDGAPPAPFTVEPRPMPYAPLALLVGSIDNAGGRFGDAVVALDRGLAVEPEHPLLTSEKGYALNRAGRSAEAEDLCARAIAADRGAAKIDVARLHRCRGFALGELGRYDEAIAAYRASQALDPGETTAANEIVYLEGRKAGHGPSAVRGLTSDQTRKPPA